MRVLRVVEREGEGLTEGMMTMIIFFTRTAMLVFESRRARKLVRAGRVERVIEWNIRGRVKVCNAWHVWERERRVDGQDGPFEEDISSMASKISSRGKVV